MKKKTIINPNPTIFDWNTTHKRIAELKVGLVTESDPPMEVLERVWAEHAQQLAKVTVQEPSGKQIGLLLVGMGDEIYALDVDCVFDIRPAEKITRVPHVPDWVKGVYNLRGHILSVVDLSLFLGLPHPASKGIVSSDSTLIAVKTIEMECAFLVDRIITLEVLSAADIRPTTELVRGLRPEYVSGVVESHSFEGDFTAILLNIQTIITDKGLVINQAYG